MLNRRYFFREAVQLTTIGLIGNRCFAADVNTIIATMVDHARNYLKAADWAPRRKFGPIKEAYYCNVFVADIAREAGAATWDPISRPIAVLPDRDPVAREWEDPTVTIKGWKVVFHAGTDFGRNSAQQILAQRQPGDVVSGTGHCGIVADDAPSFKARTFSASAITGAVELTDWSFRLPDTTKFASAAEWETAAKNNVRKFTVRRFVGT